MLKMNYTLSIMIIIEMYVAVECPCKEKEELNRHPLLKLPYVKWGKDCDCLGHINVSMEDQYEYEFRELCSQHSIQIMGDIRRNNI